MPKRPAETDDYESDGGFVDDAPKSSSKKKVKAQKKNGGNGGNAGQLEWELSKNKRVAISEFKGKTMIDIREMYEKDGAKLPGKKGIALASEQFQILVSSLPEIVLALEHKGVAIKVPDFGDGTKKSKKDKEDSSEEEEEEEEEEEDEE